MAQQEEKLLSVDERHKIVMDKLKEFKKKTRVFDMRWTQGDPITDKILKSTPMFWYFRFGWTRRELEELFFAAQIYIDEAMDNALDAVFGPANGKKGRRWIPRDIQEKLGLWKNKDYSSKPWWEVKAPQNLFDQRDALWAKFAGNSDQMDFKMFLAALKGANVNITDELAKKLFDSFANKDGFIDKKAFDALLKLLDNTKLDPFNLDISKFTINDLKDPNLLNIFTKLAMLNAFDMPIPGDTFTEMLLTRDADWKDRLKLMQNIMANLGVNPNYDDLLNNPQHFSDLIMGWLAQMLDTNEQVSKFAIENLVKLIKMNPSVALIHLNDIIDTIFNILNNVKHSHNHEIARKAMIEIIDFIVETQNSEIVLNMANILCKYLDIEVSIDANARGFGLYCIKRILMKENAEKMIILEMPTLPSPQREWLNMAIKKSVGPSNNIMYQGDKYNESLKNNKQNNKDEIELKTDLAKLNNNGSNNNSNNKNKVKLSKADSNKNENKKTSREIGKDFFDTILRAIETGLMDPNKSNRDEAARLAQVLDEMADKELKYISLLNGDAKKKYYQSSIKRKRSSKELPTKALPTIPKLEAKTSHHDISQKVGLSIKKPVLPNI